MLKECCGEGYIWSIPYGSLNYCGLTQGTTVCSHMTVISQSCVLTVCTPAQVCSLRVGTVLHWSDPVLCLLGSFMGTNKRQIVCVVCLCKTVHSHLCHLDWNIEDLRVFLSDNVHSGSRTKKFFDTRNNFGLKKRKSVISQCIFFCAVYLLPNIQHAVAFRYKTPPPLWTEKCCFLLGTLLAVEHFTSNANDFPCLLKCTNIYICLKNVLCEILITICLLYITQKSTQVSCLSSHCVKTVPKRNVVLIKRK